MDGNADAQQAKALPAPGDESGLPVDETREDVGLLVASSSGPPAAERIPKATSQPLAKASTPYLCILFTLGTVCVLFLTWIIVSVWKGLAWGGEVTIVGPVTSSPTEDRSFAYIALPNGLQAFLVSDPDAVSAGIAVDVKVGSLYDPPEYAGLAHGVEHLLFQGTQKFPGEDEYNQYLAKNGGSSNAYTDSEDTNYHLSVANHALEGAMDRFSQFFISPIFNESSLMRELNAVNSEHLKNLQNQNWRSYQLVKHVSAEGKPFNSFSTGNMETLNKPGIRSAMLAFHARHYYASNMRLAVISQESIETMTSMVASKFASVPARPRTTLAALTATKLYQSVPKEELEKAIEAVANKSEIVTNTQASLSADVAYPPATHRGIIIETVPVTESHTLTILFPLPSQADSDSDRTGSVRFLSDLLGDEGSGSILSYLKNPSPNLSTDPAPFSLIESVSTGLEVDLKGFSMLSIQVHFSPAFIDRARAEVASKVGSNGGGNATAQATSGILTAASNRVAAAVFAYLQIVSDELEGAVQQSVQLLGTTGNEDRLCGAHRSLLIDAAALANQTKTDASTANQQPRFVAGALPLAATKTPPPPSAVLDHSVGSVNDDLGMCRARDGSLVSWPGNASSNAAFRVWSESQLMASLRFRYPLKGEADHAASGFARSAHRDGPLDILSPPSRSVWQPRLIHAVLQRFMKPENMIMLLSSSLFSSSKLLDSVEPIYNSRYRKTKIDTTKLAKSPTSLLDKQITVELPGGGDSFKFPALVEPFSKLHLPPTNPFLPKDFSLARHSGYATLLGLVDIDDVAASVNNDPKQRGLAPVKEQVLDPPHVPTRESSAALVEQLRSSDGLVNDATALRSSNEAGIAAAYKLKPMLLPLDDLLVPDTTAKHRSMALSVTEASPISAFWLPDAFFGRPKTFVVVELISPTVASSTPTNQILTALLINLVKEQLRETAYAANRGGASFSLSALSFGGGLALSVESYSQVTPALMEALIKPLASLAHTSSSSSSNVASEIAPRLVSDLTLMLHGLRNARKDQPYKRALYRLDLLLGARRYSAGQLAAALLSLASAEASSDGAVTLPTKAVSLGDSLLLSEEPLTVKDSGALANALLKHAKDLFADFASANIFIYGNENVQSARALAKTIVAEHLKPQHLLDELKESLSKDTADDAVFTNVTRATVSALKASSPVLAPSPPPFVAVRPLAAGTKATMAIKGDNPNDLNSATVRSYQLGLRDSCSSVLAPSSPRFASHISLSFDEVMLPDKEHVVARKVFVDGKKVTAKADEPAAADSADTTAAAVARDFSARRKALRRLWTGGKDEVVVKKSSNSILTTLSTFFSSSTRESARHLESDEELSPTEEQVTKAGKDLQTDCTLRGAATDMLGQLIKDPAFNHLRTNLQLGYIVFATSRHADTIVPASSMRVEPVPAISLDGKSLALRQVPRLAFGDSFQSLVVLVQGAEKAADVMDNRAAEFVQSFESDFLSKLTSQDWSSALEGVKTAVTRLPVSMGESFALQWEEIGRRSFSFNRRAVEADSLSKLRLEHVIALYREALRGEKGEKGPAVATVDVFGKGKEPRMPSGDDAATPTVVLPAT